MANTELESTKRTVKGLAWFAQIMTRNKRFAPLAPGWKGAMILLAALVCPIFFMQGYFLIGERGLGDYLTGVVLFMLAVALITGVLAGLLHWAKRLPTRYVWLALASFCLLIVSFIGPVQLMLATALSMIAAFSLLGAILFRWITGAYRKAKTIAKVTAVSAALAAFAFIAVGGCWLASGGNAELAKPYRLKTMKPADRYPAAMENPAKPGPFAVKTLTYGSANSYRKEFNAKDSLVTRQVDGSAFVKNWSSIRTHTFGFGPEAMPLNGHVWYPDGAGPFPLVVIAHGNHVATEYSDVGYAYLGNLLASRGFIAVSIDENFLNTSPYDDLFMLNVLEKENPARGWLMLQHLKVWDGWNKAKGNPFYGKADMSRIALIGHSRGGEAVSVAAAYNRLSAYPENANIKFSYNFGIRSVISIAGTDGQYKPAGQPTVLKDVNYLALQGSHDMDVSSFDGASQFSRIRYTGSGDYFKSSVYMHGANHGQFNTVWGRTDGAGLGNKLYNIAQLIPQEEQLQAAKVLISSFLEATLHEKKEYGAVFRDLGHAREWLPDTMYISNYWDSKTALVASFDEDADPGTTTLHGGRLVGEGLKEWKEEKVEMKFAPAEYGAVSLGWERAPGARLPSYTVVLPGGESGIRPNGAIVFSMADRDDKKKASGKNELVDLTIRVEDKNGSRAELPLSSAGSLLPMFEGKIVKWPFASALPIKEPVFQNFAFRLADFKKINPSFQPEQLQKIVFAFDKTDQGTVLIRDIGIRSGSE